MESKHDLPPELQELGQTGHLEKFENFEARENEARDFLNIEGRSIASIQPEAYGYLTTITEAAIARERSLELDTVTPTESEVKLAIRDGLRKIDDLRRQLSQQGEKFLQLEQPLVDLTKQLQASQGDLASNISSDPIKRTSQLDLLQHQATTTVAEIIRQVAREAYDLSLGGLAHDESFGRLPSRIEEIVRGEPDSNNEQAA